LNGAPSPFTSRVSGIGLTAANSGELSTFYLHMRDDHQREVQLIQTRIDLFEPVYEMQSFEILGSFGESFKFEFRGKATDSIIVGVTSMYNLKVLLEQVFGQITLTSSGEEDAIMTGDKVHITFLGQMGDIPQITSSSSSIVVGTNIDGRTPYRKEVQAIFCDAEEGESILEFHSGRVVIDHQANSSEIEAVLSTLTGTSIKVLANDQGNDLLCNDLGKRTLIEFEAMLHDFPPIKVVSSTTSTGTLKIYGSGEENYGAINGINPVMGSFLILYNGAVTSPVFIYDSADTLKLKLEALPFIGNVTITKDVFGISPLVPTSTSLFSAWTITFGRRDPSKLGDIDMLKIDFSSIYVANGNTTATKNPIKVFESRKGTAGNDIIDNNELVDVSFSLKHLSIPNVSIGIYEEDVLFCAASHGNQISGSFSLQLQKTKVSVDAALSLHEFDALLKNSFSLFDFEVSSDSPFICNFEEPMEKVEIRIKSRRKGSRPNFEVSDMVNVNVSVVTPVEGHDYISRSSDGKFELGYTPILSGHYSISVYLKNETIWEDISFGVHVGPSGASAQLTSHDSALSVLQGKSSVFFVQEKDRFGNIISGKSNNTLFVNIVGEPSVCSGKSRSEVSIAVVEESEGTSFKVSYLPKLAGDYLVSAELAVPGGLLATYFEDVNYTIPVYGNLDHMEAPYHEVPWCPNTLVCDSTRLAQSLHLDMKMNAPVANGEKFPMDFYSIKWEGYIKVPADNLYTFFLRATGMGKLVIDSKVVIDNGVLEGSIALNAKKLHSVSLYYVHFQGEGYFDVQWSSNAIDKSPIPSSALCYARNISNSPFTVSVSPGVADRTSTAFGKGLYECTVNSLCTFAIQAKDSNGNNVMDTQEAPEFFTVIKGIDGWAKKGPVVMNSSVRKFLISDIPAFREQIDVNEDCIQGLYIVSYTPSVRGLYSIDVMIGNNSIFSFPKSLNVFPGATHPTLTSANGRGLVEGMAGETSTFTIQARDIFGNNRLTEQELDKFYVLVYPESGDSVGVKGDIVPDIAGMYSVHFVPKVSGVHTISIVQVTQTEVQNIRTAYKSHLRGGVFVLKYGNCTTQPLSWDSPSQEIKGKLEEMSCLTSGIDVRRDSVDHVNFIYSITFHNMLGNLEPIESDTSNLEGSMSWNVSSTDGEYMHIGMNYGPIEAAEFSEEIQRIRLSGPFDSYYSMKFKGEETEDIFFNNSASEIKDKLQKLPSVGDVNVGTLIISEAFENITTVEWVLSFTPNSGKCFKSLSNYGNLPELVSGILSPGVEVHIETIENGLSPFSIYVGHNEPSGMHSVASDSPGVSFQEGIETGIYNEVSMLKVQTRDKYSNKVVTGPARERQVRLEKRIFILPSSNTNE